MLRHIRLVSTVLVFWTCDSLSQSSPDSTEDRADEVVEATLESATRDLEDSQFAEELMQLETHPIDLNKATASDLQQIPGVDMTLAMRIVSFRERHPFDTVDDLLQVEGVDAPLFLQIRSFLVVRVGIDDDLAMKRASVRFTQRTITRLQNQRGYVDGEYAGNPLKIYNKLIVQSPFLFGLSVETGGLAEKDPGERTLTDFWSGFVSVTNRDRSVKLILGDYAVEAGQGLSLWRSMTSTKGSDVVAGITRSPRGLRPYTSSDENGFLRGGGIEVRWNGIDATVFVSRRRINATVNEQGAIASFDASGLFRTQTEIQKKSIASEEISGMNVDFRVTEGLRSGIRGYTAKFDRLVDGAGASGFRGRNAAVGSVDFSYGSQHVASFGEVAVDHLKSVACIGGVVLKPVQSLDVALVLRSYPIGFVSLHGYGFGESGGHPENEKGVYASVRVVPFSWLAVSTYFDQFATLGASQISLLPVHGSEFFALLQIEPDRKTTVLCQMGQKDKAVREYFVDPFLRQNPVVGKRMQNSYRVTFEWRPSPVVRWKTRIERVDVRYTVAGGPGKGILLYQDLRIRPAKGLTVDGRVVVFDTDSYDSRVYEFESELRGTFANPALYGKGVRMYVLGRYRWTLVEFSAKYSTTLRPAMRALGSGGNEIAGDLDNQISVQLEVRV